MMYADIVIRSYDDDLASRLTIHDGTICYCGEMRFGPQLYRPNAFLPRGTARVATVDELATLVACDAPPARNRVIGIVRFTPQLIAQLRQAREHEGKIGSERMQQPPFFAIAAELEPEWTVRGPLMPLGFACYPPGFHTVTFDAAAERFIGLHIDDLDRQPIHTRENSTTRLCINLGECSRYLLFMNLSARSMARMLQDDAAMAMRATPLIHAFMRKFPDYPVARLAIRPGEAYLAPTENLIHDGSTLGMARQDLQVTVRGSIDPLFHAKAFGPRPEHGRAPERIA
jgi:hypothetical protein